MIRKCYPVHVKTRVYIRGRAKVLKKQRFYDQMVRKCWPVHRKDGGVESQSLGFNNYKNRYLGFRASLAEAARPPLLKGVRGSAALRFRSHPPPKSTHLGFRVILPPSLPPSHGGKCHAGGHRLRASAIDQATPPSHPLRMGGRQRSSSSGGVMMRRSTASGVGITEDARRAGRVALLRTSPV